MRLFYPKLYSSFSITGESGRRPAVRLQAKSERTAAAQGLRRQRHLQARASKGGCATSASEGLPLRERRDEADIRVLRQRLRSRLWPHCGGRDGSCSGGEYRVYSGLVRYLINKVGSLSSLKHARKKGNGGPPPVS